MKDFFAGFEKAAGPVEVSVGAALGAALGGALGTIPLGVAHRDLREAIKADPERGKSKALIAKLKKHAPGVKFITRDDLEKTKNKPALYKEKMLADAVRSLTSEDTGAAYYRSHGIGEAAKEYIALPDETTPSVIGHEIGHYLSHKEIEKLPPERQVLRLETSTQEEEAWKKAPVKVDQRTRDNALRTYRYSKYPAAGVLLGGLGGGILGALLKG